MSAAPKKRKRSPQKYRRVPREYDENAGSRRAYMAMLSGLPKHHIVHSARIRSLITQHLMVPGVRRETRAIYKLYTTCKPRRWSKVTKCIRGGTTIYDLATPMHQRASCKQDNVPRPSDCGLLKYHDRRTIAHIRFEKCSGFPAWHMDWTPLRQLLSLTIQLVPSTKMTMALPDSFCDSFPNMHDLRLHGGLSSLPPSIVHMSSLKRLVLRNMGYHSGDTITSLALPDELGDLNLHTLVLTNCQLQGPIPAMISRIKNLQVLELDDNHLTGPIPEWVPRLENLHVLDFSKNELTGTINFEAMSKLTFLDLRENHLRVPGIPAQLQPELLFK